MIYPIYKKARVAPHNSNEFVGTVVKFTGPTIGVVIAVVHEDAPHKLGFQSRSWINHTNESTWEDISPADEFFRVVSRQLFELPCDVSLIID
jgi:hypothetical protein